MTILIIMISYSGRIQQNKSITLKTLINKTILKNKYFFINKLII